MHSNIFNWHIHGHRHKDTKKDTDKDMDTDMDMNIYMELKNFYYISICRFSPYRAVWITYDTSRRKFQRHYKNEAQFHDENYNMQIFKILFCRWNCALNNVQVGLEISVWG